MNTLKKIFAILLVICVPGILAAQSNPLDSYIDKYEGQDGFFFLKLETNLAGVEGEGESTIIAASGNFDLKDLAKFNNIKKCKGLEILGELCDD